MGILLRAFESHAQALVLLATNSGRAFSMKVMANRGNEQFYPLISKFLLQEKGINFYYIHHVTDIKKSKTNILKLNPK